ncbi:MBL fold metallo-hydrolase [Methanomethylophilus alvi]|uniref:MBL fold metallo-hydrolase n=1 Tax=Methanomethylophilus alvi TaxID=1291540 RepID=UPI0037DC260B
MEKVKITVVYDEGALPNTNLIGAIGMSILVEADGRRTLFGLGHRPRYLEHNLSSLDIESDSIDQIVVSHRHIDHFGGLAGFLKGREKPIDIYAPAGAWGGKKTVFGPTGIFEPEEFTGKTVRHDITDWVQLSDHVFVSPPLTDNGSEESFLVISSSSGPLLISGCCHPGLDHVFEAVKAKFGRYPTALIGGLHILKKQDKLADLYAQYLKDVDCRRLYLNHCTGVNGINRMRVTLGLKGINDFYAGQSIEFNLV